MPRTRGRMDPQIAGLFCGGIYPTTPGTMTAATTTATFRPTGSFPVILRPIPRMRRSGLPDCSALRPTTADIIKPVARDGTVPTTRRPAISWDMTARGTAAVEGIDAGIGHGSTGRRRSIRTAPPPCKRPRKGPFDIYTASFAALTGRALTIFRAGLALNIIGSPLNGLVPARALVAGFLITTNLANPGTRKTPDFFSSL